MYARHNASHTDDIDPAGEFIDCSENGALSCCICDKKVDGSDNGIYDYENEYAYCTDCGGQMTWCETCQMYTKTCCQEYGSCMCS